MAKVEICDVSVARRTVEIPETCPKCAHPFRIGADTFGLKVYQLIDGADLGSLNGDKFEIEDACDTTDFARHFLALTYACAACKHVLAVGDVYDGHPGGAAAPLPLLERAQRMLAEVDRDAPCAAEPNGMSHCATEEAGHFEHGRVEAMCLPCRARWYALKLSDAVEDLDHEQPDDGKAAPAGAAQGTGVVRPDRGGR